MKKLLVICGPTATGKTTLAIKLAKKIGGEIISADSRQVYKGMDVGTGKDLPRGLKIKYPWFGKYGYYEIDGVKIWGYDLTSPKSEFSVSEYMKFANKTIYDILKDGKLPILVGGTGLYIKGVVDGIPTAQVPRNPALRKNLETCLVDELYETLSQMDSLKAASLNSSDKKNPRRLVRAIEVASWQINHRKRKIEPIKKGDIKSLFIGLKAPKNFIAQKIRDRVEERIKDEILNEIGRLLRQGVTWQNRSMSSLGYGIWRDYFENKKSEKEIIGIWEREEEKYVSRQMVWFKKDRRINWFDITDKNFPRKVEKMVEKWYHYSDVPQDRNIS